MEDIRNKLLIQKSGEMFELGMVLRQSHKQVVKSVHETCLKKCRDDETLFETTLAYKKDLEQKDVAIKEKTHAITERMSEMELKDAEKEILMQKIQMLREEHSKRRELIVSQNKANKGRLKNLNKAKQVFEDGLRLEIRKIHGEKLQFIFRNINHLNQDHAYTFTLRINEDGAYQILSSDPVLECMPVLEQRLLETNNFAAFLANVRKEFVALSKL